MSLSRPALELATDVIPVVRTNVYPSFSPEYENCENLKGRWLDLTKSVVFRDQAHIPSAHVASFSNAIVVGNGFVCTADGQFVRETLRESGEVPIFDSNKVREIEGEVCLLRKPGDSNFGHWLIELLPRVREFQKVFPNKNLIFAIPQNNKTMLDLQIKTLNWFGVQEENIIALSNDPVSFETVHIITSNSIHSHTHDCDGVRAVAAAGLREASRKENSSPLIYLSRSKVGRRNVTNEDKLANCLAKFGFKTVIPEDLSIEDQITLFSEAKVVVGVSGAALTNIIWMKEGTHVISLNPNYGHEFFFWDLASIMKLKFYFLFGESVSPAELGHSDFEINIEIFEEILESILVSELKDGGTY